MVGVNNLHPTGVTILDNTVELIKPPISTMAKGEINGLVDHAIGKRPPIAVNVVKTIGKKRISPASRIAASKGFPSVLSWVVKSNKRMVFSLQYLLMLLIQ